MTCPIDPRDDLSLDARTVEEFDALLSRLCDDTISANDRRRLNQLMDQSPAVRRYYLKTIALHSALVTTAGSHVRPEFLKGWHDIEPNSIQTFDEAPVLESIAKGLPLWHRRKTFVRQRASAWLVATAILWCIGLVLLSNYRGQGFAVESSSARLKPALAVDSVTTDGQELVATVTYLSPTVRWHEPNTSYALDAPVRTGQSLRLELGELELTYPTGARLILTGPSDFVVDSTGGKLRRGELIARVPDSGHGFRIETPQGQVTDLGTEFGIVVDDFGVSQVSVFEGKVETVPIGVVDPKYGRIELTSGRGLQLTGKAIIPMNAMGSRYRAPRFADRTGAQSVSAITATLEHDFRNEQSFQLGWKSLGLVKPVSQGLQLGGTTNTVESPYVITRREFDPSQGRITVVCDVRFVDTSASGNASFAILTRSSEVISKPGLPGQELLARFLRCSFRVDPNSDEGILETGAKYEADRELWNISWGGFSRPQLGTLYRLEMQDDGLNVDFTVSQVENPAIRKTIRCRSVFSGDHNFVALEGTNESKAIVERAQILQERLADRESDQLVSSNAPRTARSSNDGAATATVFDSLIPAKAKQLVSDDFDTPKLDPAIWKPLGFVTIVDGQAQLGMSNEADHIDTWKQRPYLLTTHQFDLRDGALTIVGKLTFAQNFLNGYGGSFAVMTRADDSHGSGPGWEYSILQRGLRANFWPAALGFDHSLEIFEKPQANTISMLAAEGFQIDPLSRSYYFRIVDDSRMVGITFIDAKDANLRKTISHPVGAAMPSAGHIGFESCWGSPILLDNVRILQGEAPPQDQLLGTNSDEASSK